MADYRKRLQYQGQAMPVSPSAVVPLDFVVQHPGPIFLPPWRDRSSEAHPVVFAIATIPTDWLIQIGEPVRPLPSLEHVTVTPIVLTGGPADLFADQPIPSVFPNFVLDVPRNQYTYQSFAILVEDTVLTPSDPFASLHLPVTFPDSVPDVARNQHTYQSNALELFGVGNLRTFFPNEYEPVIETPNWDIPRRQHEFQFFTRGPATEEITPVTDVFASAPLPVVFPNFVYDRERLQHSYPFLFSQLADWPTVVGPDTQLIYRRPVFFPVTHKRRVYL